MLKVWVVFIRNERYPDKAGKPVYVHLDMEEAKDWAKAYSKARHVDPSLIYVHAHNVQLSYNPVF